MPDNVSPEEKLFKIIQNGKNAPPGEEKPPEPEAKKKPEGLKRLFKMDFKVKAPRRIRPQAAPAVAGAHAGAGMPLDLRADDLAAINKILAVVLVIVAAFTFYYTTQRRPRVEEITRQVSGIPFERTGRTHIEALKPLTYYMDWVKKRNILEPAPEAKEEKAAEKKAPKKKLAELASGLKLQGISWGETPKAMILSDSDGQIYFLEEGKKIGITGIEIKKITKDKVMVSYGDEEMELL